MFAVALLHERDRRHPKGLQDFLAPELRAIDVRLAALEKRFDEAPNRIGKRFDAMDQRIEDSESRMEKRFDSLDRRLDYVLSKLDYMTDVQEMKIRLARLEAQTNRIPDASSEAA